MLFEIVDPPLELTTRKMKDSKTVKQFRNQLKQTLIKTYE